MEFLLQDQPAAKQRDSILSIQILRGIAALGVVVVHISSYEFALKFSLPDALPKLRFGNAGVDLFFVISGFVIVYASERLFARPRAAQEFFARRAVRIVPIYWLTTTIILIYLLLQYRNLSSIDFTVGYVIASYLFIPYGQTTGFTAPVHGVGWTLNYEMFFYVLFCAAVLFTRRIGVMLLTFALIALVAVGSLWRLPLPFGFWADPIILEFALGMLIALLFRADVRVHPAISAIVVIAAIISIVASEFAPDHPSGFFRLVAWGAPSAAIVGALVLADAPARPGPVSRAFGFLGDASYALYLVHPIAITLPRQLFPQIVQPASWPWLYAALLLVTALTAAAALHLLIERPVTRLLQRRVSQRFRGIAAVGEAPLSHPRTAGEGDLLAADVAQRTAGRE